MRLLCHSCMKSLKKKKCCGLLYCPFYCESISGSFEWDKLPLGLLSSDTLQELLKFQRCAYHSSIYLGGLKQTIWLPMLIPTKFLLQCFVMMDIVFIFCSVSLLSSHDYNPKSSRCLVTATNAILALSTIVAYWKLSTPLHMIVNSGCDTEPYGIPPKNISLGS